jgi:hypothetical protein
MLDLLQLIHALLQSIFWTSNSGATSHPTDIADMPNTMLHNTLNNPLHGTIKQFSAIL